jgi:RimJ/RimL family protein N-acetyltransferase
MEISFRKFEPASDSEKLALLISSQSWPFHVHSNISMEQIFKSISDGTYSNDATQTFWILADADPVGIIKLFEMDDLEDGSPLFDIRILSRFQGRGIGQTAVKWLTGYLFEGWASLNRVEGTTRADNISMRRVFKKCGYVKEGHYRESWPSENGILQDTVRYSILRSDWKEGKLTPVAWNDE